MAKISGNPMKAFYQGVDEGLQKGYNAGYKDGGNECIDYARYFDALAIYNIARDFTRSDKKARELVKRFCEEQDRLYGDEFFGNEDQVLVALMGTRKVYNDSGVLRVVKLPEEKDKEPKEYDKIMKGRVRNEAAR